MSYHQPSASSGCGVFAALLFLALLFVLGVGGAGFVWFRLNAAPMPMAPVNGGAPGPAPAAAPAPPQASYQIQPKSCLRLPSGDCRVILTLAQIGEGELEQFALQVTTDGGTACPLESPPLAAPFPASADVVVRVPKEASNQQPIRLRVSTTVRGRYGFAGSYSSSRSSTLVVPMPAGEEETAVRPDQTAAPAPITAAPE